MSQPLLEVRELKKYFPVLGGVLRREVASVKAVDGVSFTLHEGEVLGMVGESGCGKSTVARTAIRLIEPTSGEIFYKGKDFRNLSDTALREIRKEIQMVFQDPFASLNPRKTIGDSIGEGLLYHELVKNRHERDERVVEVLESVGLSADAINKYPHEFSGGQQQRICIGRAIALNPSLIICDEAVSALDVSVQAQILNLLHSLKDKLHLSYMFISHDLSVIRHVSDRVVVLYLGKVMEVASVADLFTNPKHPYTQALLAAVPADHPRDSKKRKALQGEIPSNINPPSGCPFRGRCPHARPECASDIPHKIVKKGANGAPAHEYFCIL